MKLLTLPRKYDSCRCSYKRFHMLMITERQLSSTQLVSRKIPVKINILHLVCHANYKQLLLINATCKIED